MTMVALIVLVGLLGLTLTVSAPTFISLSADINRYIVVIDDNFVSRASGKRKLYESTLKAWQTVDPKCCQMFASKENEKLMSQCSMLFSKQVDAWHINHFWFVKLIINRCLNKLEKQISAAQAKMVQ